MERSIHCSANIERFSPQPERPEQLPGAGFMQQLIATGLIYEYHLAVHPVALGSGLPIFSALKTPVYLKLAEVKVFPKGIIAHTYHV
ncbi:MULTISPECIES: dihydrofolate reductase family protein [unclassified Chitinophaga]|uniref:dihydrofolate reductase family protein n=1 Tax=unclassified Chitinophaga TaxID=2619133 RepID=UPI00300FD011